MAAGTSQHIIRAGPELPAAVWTAALRRDARVAATAGRRAAAAAATTRQRLPGAQHLRCAASKWLWGAAGRQLRGASERCYVQRCAGEWHGTATLRWGFHALGVGVCWCFWQRQRRKLEARVVPPRYMCPGIQPGPQVTHRLSLVQARRQPARRQRCPLMAVALSPVGATPHSSRRVGIPKAAAAAATPQPWHRHCSPSRASGRLPQPAATAAARRPPGARRLLRRRLAATARATDRAVRPGRRRPRSPTSASVRRHLTAAWGVHRERTSCSFGPPPQVTHQEA